MTTVLFVDDEPAILNATRRSLRSEPYEVLTASSAKDALAILATRQIDVLVSDARMPEMSGFELIAKVCADYPGTVCIMLTGAADLGATSSLIQSGALYRFLCKPISAVALRGVLHGALLMCKWTRESDARLRKPAA
ncbi:MAG: response regulator [Polyangiaceae bacterium]